MPYGQENPRETTMTLSLDPFTTDKAPKVAPVADKAYLELRLRNGTSIFVPIDDPCIPTD